MKDIAAGSGILIRVLEVFEIFADIARFGPWSPPKHPGGEDQILVSLTLMAGTRS